MELCQVSVEGGVLQGKECKTFYGKKYYSFEGIPYARPPLGELRFRDPQPPEPWTGIRDATKPGNKATQANPYSSTPLEGSEDCLYLNVYTPVLPAEETKKLPVFFFIHGGRLIFGYGNYYTPDYLIKHDVILVTLNYRLNILGWLCLNIPECPGNAGLKDTAMALKWVNKNIAKFSGDENNVIISGESAGGAMASSFLTSKMTEGLFSKVVALSGNCIADLYLIEDDPIEKAIKVASVLGKNLTNQRELYDFLIQVPIDDLIIAFTETELSRPRSVLNAYFGPVVEKCFDGVEPFFTESTRVAIKENRFHKVPILTAANLFEAAIFFSDHGSIIYENDLHYFLPQFAHLERGSERAKMVESRISDFYLGRRNVGDNVKREYLQMVSDVYFWRDIFMMAEYVSKYWDKVYILQFNYTGNMHTRLMSSIGMQGSTHGDMIQYLFYRRSKAATASEKDWRIVEMLVEAICSFANTGKPSWSNQKTKWLPYTQQNRHTLIVDEEISLAKDLGLDRIHFWQDLEKYYYSKSTSKL